VDRSKYDESSNNRIIDYRLYDYTLCFMYYVLYMIVLCINYYVFIIHYSFIDY
jgi:hypothetical protein